MYRRGTLEARRSDGPPTDGTGARGRMGVIGSDAEIGVAELLPNTSAAGAVGEARRGIA